MDDASISLHFFPEDLEPDRIRDDYDVSTSGSKYLRKESTEPQSQSVGNANLLFTSSVPVPENQISMTKLGNNFDWNGVSKQGAMINSQAITPSEPLTAFSSGFLGCQQDSGGTTNEKSMVISTPLTQVQVEFIFFLDCVDYHYSTYMHSTIFIYFRHDLLNCTNTLNLCLYGIFDWAIMFLCTFTLIVRKRELFSIWLFSLVLNTECSSISINDVRAGITNSVEMKLCKYALFDIFSSFNVRFGC